MPSKPSLRAVGKTDTGRKRAINEDAFSCNDDLGLYIVADGVGGHAKGEVASREACEQIQVYITQHRSVIDAFPLKPTREQREAMRRLLESAVQSACYMVFGLAELDPTQRGMSTTISALLIAGDRAFTAQVGDSRIYRIRDGKGVQLTEDHTLVNYKLKLGLITEQEARTMKGRNVITRAVGHKDYVEVDTRELDVQPSDRYMLCSDGLHGYLRAGDLERVLEEGPREQAPDRFIQMANERGGKDNITVIMVYVDDARQDAQPK